MPNEKLHKIFATATVLLGLFIAAMESLIGSTILPSILASLGGFDLYPWMVSAFLLALVVTTPLFGKMADHYGFYRVYLIAIGFFLTGSLFCGLSQTMSQLIVSRTVQGIGTAGLINLCMLYVGIAFPLNQRHKLGALVSSIWALASLLGPAIGAVIAAYSSWRFAFLINVPLCLIILTGSRLYFRHLPKPPHQGPFDTLGACYFTIATLLLLLVIVSLGKGIFGLQQAGLAIAALAFFVILYFNSKGKKSPFLTLEPLKHYPHLAVAMAVGALCGAFLFSTSNFLPLFVQGALGLGVKEVGYVITSMALGTCMGSFLTAMLLGRLGFKYTLMISFVFLLCGVFLITSLFAFSTLSQILIANFCLGTGIGMSSNCSIVATQNYSPRSQLGVNTGLFGFFRSVGGMLTISMLGSIQIATYQHEMALKAKEASITGIHEAIGHPEWILNAANRLELSSSLLKLLEESLATSIHYAFLGLFPLLLVHLFLTLKMPKTKPHEIGIIPEPETMGE